MTTFLTYFELGFDHILDLSGYDHMLFLIALIAGYAFFEWRHIIILITAFTIGHCMTLILAGKGLIVVNSSMVEIAIAASIALTALVNLVGFSKDSKRNLTYTIALIFGLIHGLGFSGFLKALIGKSEVLWKPLLYFNLGVETGQIVFVSVLLVVNFMWHRLFKLDQKFWRILFSSIALLWSIWMVVERI